MKFLKLLIVYIVGLCTSAQAQVQHAFNVKVNAPSATIEPDHVGCFF